MSVQCPHCKHGIAVRAAKPGRYQPVCPKCGQRFLLLVPATPGEPLRVGLPAASATGNEATLPPAAQTTPEMAATFPPPPPKAPSAAPSNPQGTKPGNIDATLPPTEPSPRAATAGKTIPARGTDPTEFLPTTSPAREAPATPALPPGVPATINGYRVLRELGRGAMGAVYLARQMSLDREVAVKTIQSQWASIPAFVARFTREAYAAAQLTHHNIVQIFDLGQDRDTRFFSMEYVRGRSLDDLVREQGKLDPEVAVGYILQAARGLHYAHSMGMVHRDVKPGNILVNEQGVIKVTDLGLVKTPQMAYQLDAADEAQGGADSAAGKEALSAATASMTIANVAMGTPAYMAPEQAENAAGVDHRADIYSLGCTLYVLLTGRPPFDGATALDVITKHKSEPVVRPEAIVKRIPPELSEITLRMVAKRPEDRYANLAEVVTALEKYLGVVSQGSFSPQEEQAQILEQSAAEFSRAPLARVRSWLPAAFLGGCLLLALGVALFHVAAASALLALAIFTPVAYAAIASFRAPGPVLRRLRSLLSEVRLIDWATYLLGALLALGVLYLLGWLGWWLVAIVFAVIGAAAFHEVCDRRLMRERQPALDRMEKLLRSLRLQGIEESTLHQFTSKYAGESWEEFFEALFGYENLRSARDKWGKNAQGALRPKFRGWRDGVIQWADRRLQTAREERDRRLLQKVEEDRLQAQGVDLISARKQAQRVADALVDQAVEQRALTAAAPATIDPAVIAARKREKMKAMMAEARAGKHQARNRRLVAAAFSPLTFALGPQVRFMLGCLLVAGCLLWARQNGLLSADQAANAAAAIKQGDLQALEKQAVTPGAPPLAVPFVGALFNSINPGVAGVMLVLLGFFGGWRMSLFALPAAAVMVLGPHSAHFGLPSLGLSQPLYLLIGLTIGGAGLIFGRTYDDRVRDNE